MLEWLKKIVKYKGKGILINIDSVGEPTTYPDLIKLIIGAKKIKGVTEVSMQTNGTLLTKEKIKKIESAGLDKINFSINSMDPELARKLSGVDFYDLNSIIEIIEYIAKNTRIELWLCPVWIPNINDGEIPKLIEFAKTLDLKLGIQKYELHKYGRKPPGVKPITYKKFYRQLRLWEKEYKVKLIYKSKEIGMEKRRRIPEVIRRGEKITAIIKAPGWFKNQAIGVARNRAITINNCKAEIGKKVKVKIIQNKNSIYLAEPI